MAQKKTNQRHVIPLIDKATITRATVEERNQVEALRAKIMDKIKAAPEKGSKVLDKWIQKPDAKKRLRKKVA